MGTCACDPKLRVVEINLAAGVLCGDCHQEIAFTLTSRVTFAFLFLLRCFDLTTRFFLLRRFDDAFLYRSDLTTRRNTMGKYRAQPDNILTLLRSSIAHALTTLQHHGNRCNNVVLEYYGLFL